MKCKDGMAGYIPSNAPCRGGAIDAAVTFAEQVVPAGCRHFLLPLLVAILTPLLLNACDRPPHGTNRSPDPAENAMTMPTTAQEALPALQTIDREIPAGLKTATLALG
jgi:hypothetical protein